MKAKQENNFQELFNTNHKKVFNISLNIVQNIEDAEDITQDVFIEVHQSLHAFNNKSAVSTWIFRIAVNKSLDFLRAKRRKKRFAFITQLFHPETGEQLHEISHFDHPGVVLENKERSQILFNAVDKLPDKQKAAFVLAKIEGFPQKDIAQIMNLSEKAVESLIQRAKENLRKLLEIIYYERGI